MKIALSGYGKMGKAIHAEAMKQGFEVVLIIDKDNIADLNPEKMQGVDVMIDFSVPDVAFSNVLKALEIGVCVVSGTTGWHQHLPEIKDVCNKKEVAFMWGSNFSVGVNLFFKLNSYLAAMMNRFPEYKASLSEVHHTKKLDAPSGTAITLATDIIANSRYSSWTLDAAESDDIINIDARREGEVVGFHQIKYESSIDEICISHNAHSRDGFVKGALLAADWIKDKKGFFDVKEMFNF